MALGCDSFTPSMTARLSLIPEIARCHRPRLQLLRVLIRVWVRQLLVIFLDQLLIALRNLIFLRRANILLCQRKLEFTAEFQFDAAQRIENLLGHFFDGFRARRSRVANRILDRTRNLIKLSRNRIVPSETVLDITDFVEPLLEFPLPLAWIIRAG